MKRTLTIIVLVLAIVGVIYLYGRSGRGVSASSSKSDSQTSSVGGDFNVCVGSAAYCQGIADMKNQAVKNQNDQYIMMMTAQAPTPAPTPSSNEVTLKQKISQDESNVLITALWTLLVIGGLAAVSFLVYQLYWYFRVKIPKDEVAPDIRQKNGLIVARLKGDPDHANSQDQFIVVDERSWGTMMVHINGNGLATPITVSDEVGKHLAMAHAIDSSNSRNHAQQVMSTLLEDWSGASEKQITALGDALANWREAGQHPEKAELAKAKPIPDPE